MINLERIRELPTKSGCYLFKSLDKQVIYVGKANNLRRRVMSYFKSGEKNRKRNFVPQIEDVDIFVTGNQKEALILEQNLIKKHQPRYNVLLKSSDSYPYIHISNNKNPRYSLTYNTSVKGGEYFGPFPDGSRAKEVLSILERALPLARCKPVKEKRECIYYSIGQCSGYCFQDVNPAYYQQIRKEVRDFFEGQTEKLKERLNKLLNISIKSLSFEIAQKQKKVVDSIDFLTSSQHVEFNDKQNSDFLGTFVKEQMLAINILIYRYGKLVTSHGKIFSLEKQFASEQEIIQSYVFQFYKKNISPSILYSEESILNKKSIEDELYLKNLLPNSEKTKKIIEMSCANAQERWNQSFFNNFQGVRQLESLEEIGKKLSISTPYTIEALDISNIFLQDAVASFSIFINGEYHSSKLYKLDPEKSDFNYMRAACQQHYGDYGEGKINRIPSLLVVDGAREQLKSVCNTLAKLGIEEIKVIGLVKNEKHQTEKMIDSANYEEIDFGSQRTRNFFTQIQNTVHNQAVAFHRKLHKKNALRVTGEAKARAD